jgi:preprotein translocase subunit SecA
VREENVTLATITFQNYFRMYDKLAGMTGTAMTEAAEFEKIYELEVTAIPTHQTVQRQDHNDLIYRTEQGKFQALVADIKERHQKGQPILVGTVAIETSERLSKLLDRAGVPHLVLNAKQHFREANIIAQAGRPGAVTIATNMAGRGVDILLGGNAEGLAREMLRKQEKEVTQVSPEEWSTTLAQAKAQCEQDRVKVVGLGGLYVLGTERHEARRIDNQLRGRSGRQGDPGESRFYLSLEDDLMRRFGGDKIKSFMEWAEIPEDQPIENRMINSSILQAQVRVEGFHFDMRKRILEYDDVVNKQREDIYRRRLTVLDADPQALRDEIQEMVAEEIHDLCQQYLKGDPSEWDFEELYRQALAFRLPLEVHPNHWGSFSAEDIENDLLKGALLAYNMQLEKIKVAGEDPTKVERDVYLRFIDEFWVQHLTDLAILREGIGLQGLRGRDPVVEYKIEGFQMYNALLEEVQSQVARAMYRFEVVRRQEQTIKNVQTVHPSVTAGATGGAITPNNPGKAEPIRASTKEMLGRNDPCWCGSGKKYKHCHYQSDQSERQTIPQEMVKKGPPARRR